MGKNTKIPMRPRGGIDPLALYLPTYLESTELGRFALEGKKKADEERKKREIERQRKRREEQLRIEADEKRRAWNKLIAERRYKREQQELKKRIAEQKTYEAKRKAEADAQIEKDYQNHSKQLRLLYNETGHNMTVGWALVFDRALWDLKNMMGSLAESSISLNGTTMEGKMSEQELRINAANAHDQMETLKRQYLGVTQLLNEFQNLYLRNQDYIDSHKNDESVRQMMKLRSDLETTKANLEKALSDPTLTGLDDAYLEFYVKDKRSIFSTISYALDPFLKGWNNQEHLRQAYKERISKDYQKYLGEDINESVGTDPMDIEAANTNKMRQEANDKMKVLRQDYMDNRQHLMESQNFWNVSQGWKKAEEAHQGDGLFDPNYWLYEMAPMVGSSMSSPALAAAATIKTVASVAGAATSGISGGMSLLALPIAEAAVTPLEVQGGTDENYAEIGMRRAENVLALLKDMDSYPERGGSEAAIERNNRIIGELKRRSAKFMKMLGRSDEYIKKYLEGDQGEKNAIQDYIMGLTSGEVKDKNGKLIFTPYNDPTFQQALMYSTQGLLAQFNTDNIRTMYDLAFQKTLMCAMPVKYLTSYEISPGKTIGGNIFRTTAGGVKKATKDVAESIRYNGTKAFGSKLAKVANELKHEIYKQEKKAAKAASTETLPTYNPEFNVGRAKGQTGYAGTSTTAAATENAAASEGAASTMWNNAKKDWHRGANLGELSGLGVTGHLGGGATGVVVGGVGRGAVTLAKRTLPARLRAAAAGFASQTEQKYYNIIDKLTPSSPLGRVLTKYGLKTVGGQTAVAINESYEEAVQHLNSKEDFASKYGWTGGDFGSLVMNDAKQGGRVFDAYMAMLGIGTSPLVNDVDFWSEAKGGAALGFFGLGNVSSVVSVASGVNNVYQEYKAADLLMTPGLMKREYDKRARMADTRFAKASMDGRGQYLITALEDMQARDSHRKNPTFTQEQYEQRKKEIKSITALSTNKHIKRLLEALGFKYKSDEYATAIADMHRLLQDKQENEEQRKLVNDKINQILASELHKEALLTWLDNEVQNNPSSRRTVASATRQVRNKKFIERLELVRELVARELLGLKEGEQLDKKSDKYKKLVNSGKFKLRMHKRSKEMWDEVQNLAEQEVTNNARSNIKQRVLVAQELKALLALQDRHTSIRNVMADIHGVMDEIRKKYGIRVPRRPDGKVAATKLQERIDLLKEQLYSLTEGTSDQFDKNLPTDKLYELANSIAPDVQNKSKELDDLFVQRAMLDIDAAITDRYYSSYTKGIVYRDGKPIYSPTLYKQEQELKHKFFQAAMNGDIELMEKLSEQQKLLNVADMRDDPSKAESQQRVEAIMKAQRDNIAITHAINDLQSEDAVSILYEQIQKDEEAERKLREREETRKALMSGAKDAFEQARRKEQPAAPAVSQESKENPTRVTPQQGTSTETTRQQKPENIISDEEKKQRRKEAIHRLFNMRRSQIKNKLNDILKKSAREMNKLFVGVDPSTTLKVLTNAAKAAFLAIRNEASRVEEWYLTDGEDLINEIVDKTLEKIKNQQILQNVDLVRGLKKAVSEFVFDALLNTDVLTEDTSEVGSQSDTDNYSQINNIIEDLLKLSPSRASHYYVINSDGTVYLNTNSIGKNVSTGNAFVLIAKDIYTDSKSLYDSTTDEFVDKIEQKLSEKWNNIFTGKREYIAQVLLEIEKISDEDKKAEIFSYWVVNVVGVLNSPNLQIAAIARERVLDQFALDPNEKNPISFTLLQEYKQDNTVSEEIAAIRNTIESLGYRFVNVRKNIYGNIEINGVTTPSCILLDLLAVNDNGEAIIIDVVSSTRNDDRAIKNNVVSAKSTLDIAEKILCNSYGITSVRKFLFRVKGESKGNDILLSYYKHNGHNLIDVDSYLSEENKEQIDQIYTAYESVYNDLEQLIGTYNHIAEKLGEDLIPSEFQKIDREDKNISVETLKSQIAKINNAISILLAKEEQLRNKYEEKFNSHGEKISFIQQYSNSVDKFIDAVNKYIEVVSSNAESTVDEIKEAALYVLRTYTNAEIQALLTIKFSNDLSLYDKILTALFECATKYNAVADKGLGLLFPPIITKYDTQSQQDKNPTVVIVNNKEEMDRMYDAQLLAYRHFVGISDGSVRIDKIVDILMQPGFEDYYRFYGLVLNEILPEFLTNYIKRLNERINETRVIEATSSITPFDLAFLRQEYHELNSLVEALTSEAGPFHGVGLVEEETAQSRILLLNQQVPLHMLANGKYTKQVYLNIADMDNSEEYRQMSVASDFMKNAIFADPTLQIDDDYINTHQGATIFLLYVNGDKAKLRITYTGTKKGSKKALVAELSLTLEPLRFNKPETAHKMEQYKKYAEKLVLHILKMLNQIKTLPKDANAHLMYDIILHPGSIVYSQNPQDQVSPKEVLFELDGNEHDLYVIKIGIKDRLGFYKYTASDGVRAVMDADNKTVIYEIKPNENNNSVRFYPGLLVYLYINGKTTFYIPFQPAQFGKSSMAAESMIQLMIKAREQDNAVSNEVTINGQRFTIEELFSMALLTATNEKRKPALSAVAVDVRNGLIKLNEKDDRGSVYTVAYSIYDDDLAPLIQHLSSIFINIDKNIINTTLGELKNNGNSVWSKVYNAVINSTQTTNVNGVEVKTVTLPNGYTFTEDDFTHKNGDGTEGRTLLGYLINTEKVVTNFAGQTYREITIDNVRVEAENTPALVPVVTPSQVQEPQQSSIKLTDDMLFMLGDSVLKRTKEQLSAFERLAKQYYEMVFGDGSDIVISNEDRVFLQTATSSASVLGYCTTKIAVLSQYAPESAIYHEAFHKLMELILPKNVREGFYAAYRNKYGQNLTDRLVAEGLTDLFVDYKNDTTVHKADRWYSNIIRWFKTIIAQINLYRNIGFVNSIKLGILYHDFERGKYKNSKPIQENIERFKQKFGDDLHYEYNGVKLEHFSSEYDINQAANAIGFALLHTKMQDNIYINTDAQITNESLKDVPERWIKVLTLPDNDNPSERVLAMRELFTPTIKKKTITKKVVKIDKKTKKKYRTKVEEEVEVTEYEKFEAIKQKVANYIANVVGDFSVRQEAEEQTNNDAYDDNQQGKGIDKHIKESYRFSRLSKVSKRVNAFFGTVPMLKFSDDGTDSLIFDTSKNAYGAGQYYSKLYIFNLMCKKLSECNSLYEMKLELSKLADSGVSPELVYINAKLNKLLKEAYGKNYMQDGYITTNGVDNINYDAEALALGVLSAVRSQVIDYTYFLGTQADRDGLIVETKSAGKDRDVYRYTKMWFNNLVSGMSGLISKVHGNNIYKYDMTNESVANCVNRGKDPIRLMTQQLKEIGSFLNITTQSVVLNGKTYDRTNVGNMRALVLHVSGILKMFGILVSADAILEYATNKVLQSMNEGNPDVDTAWALGRLFSPADAYAGKFYNTLESFSQQDSQFSNYNIVSSQLLDVKNTYAKLGFVNELADIQSSYNQFRTTQMRYGFGSKKMYIISQNSGITHILKQLNSDNDNEVVRTLKRFSYNYFDNNGTQRGIGSIILKNVGTNKIRCHTVIGVRGNVNKDDMGNAYSEMAPIDDYITKLNSLSDGIFIFPTLADKSTYYTLSGVSLPGIQYKTISAESGVETVCTGISERTKPMWYDTKDGPVMVSMPTDAQLDQMLEYAYTEKAAIEKCMEDLKDGKISEKDYVANYHTKKQGCRFWSLTELYVPHYLKATDDNGNNLYEIKRYCLNNKNQSPEELLKIANDNFFNRSIDEQRQIMALTISMQTKKELEKAVKNNIIGIDKNGAYYSKMLPNNKILAIVKAYSLLFGDSFKKLSGKTKVDFAIRQFFTDVQVKSIMCAEETFRCFSGHPGQFKVRWSSDGEIEDAAFDIQKRIGGLVSTGDDNAMDLATVNGPQGSNKYRAAELKSYKVNSSSDCMATIQSSIARGQIIDVIGERARAFEADPQKYLFKPTDSEETKNMITAVLLEGRKAMLNLSDDELKLLSERFGVTSLLEKANAVATEIWTNYTAKGAIDVADGAAYVSSEMCERMLRTRGALTKKVKKAFDILNSDSTAYSWLDNVDAYDTVYNAVNLVATKYTAYGFRPHRSMVGEDGAHYDASDMAVAYYYKFALFPIFKCLATGHLDGIYQKMLSLKVDMLLMDSAVKVGSQGATQLKDGTIQGDLNVYEQDLGFIRRQLETDPEEGDTTALGTQLTKIALSAIRPDFDYVDPDTGETLNGRRLLDELMTAIKDLSKIMSNEVKKEFFSKGILDLKKLSEYLYKLFSGKNANENQLKMLKVGAENEKLEIPLEASPDASWIDQIIHKYVYKKVLDIVTPGTSFVQRSVLAMEGTASANMLYKGDKLLLTNDKGSMDCVLSIDFFDHMIPDRFIVDGEEVDKEFASFNQRKQFLLENNIIGRNAETLCIGYRIPTQTIASINALRCVDIIPAVKTTVILPEEFTMLTGSDFDIDHLYLATRNYKYKNGKLTRTDGLDEKQRLQNRIVSLYMTAINNHDKSNHLLVRSIDEDTKLPKEIADQIPDFGSTKNMAYNFGTLHEQTDRKNDYITGAEGIGPFALNVTSTILTQQFPLYFDKTDPFILGLGIKGLSSILDKNGDFVSAWLSGYINGHVDIVKDPWVSKLNVNSTTYNMLNFLIRAGYGEFGTWLITQPIIRDIAYAQQNNKSSLIKKDYSAVKNAMLEYITNKQELSDILEPMAPFVGKARTNGKIISRRLYRGREINRILNGNALQDFIAVTTGKIKKDDPSWSSTQLTAAKVWFTLKPLADMVGDFVLCTKIDTRKCGNTFAETALYLDKYKKMTESVTELNYMFDLNSMKKFINDTWIEYKTKTAILVPSDVLREQCFAANKSMLDFAIKCCDLFDNSSPLFVSAILNAKITKIKQDYFILYANNVLGLYEGLPSDEIPLDKTIKGLFFGNRCMANRLMGLQLWAATKEEFKYLLDNKLILALYAQPIDYSTARKLILNLLLFDNDKIPQFISIYSNVDDDSFSESAIIDGWNQLLQDEHKSVRDFAKALIVYAALTSGNNKGWNKLFKYIPAEWISGKYDANNVSYADYIKDALRQTALLVNTEDVKNDLDIDMIAANNLEALVRPYKKKDLYFAEDSHVILKTDQRNIPLYVSKPGSNIVYRLIHTTKSKMSLYVKIPSVGYHDNKNNDIFEYGFLLGYEGNDLRNPISYIRNAMDNIKEIERMIAFDAYSIPRISEIVSGKQSEDFSAYPAVAIATRDYTKNMPSLFRQFMYVFTENAQAYAYQRSEDDSSYEMWSDQFAEESGVSEPKLNVNAPGNLANIRTDLDGLPNPNAIGIVVKKLQQKLILDKADGKHKPTFVKEEGQFKDTEEDYMIFKQFVDDAISTIMDSGLRHVVFPKTIAMGKAALPMRFATYIKDVLQQTFGISSEISKNTTPGYSGYGLTLNSVDLTNSRFAAMMATNSIKERVRELAKDEPNPDETAKQIVSVFETGITFLQQLSTTEVFFTQEELNEIKQRESPLRVKSVSRHTDPVFFSEKILQYLQENAKLGLSDDRRTLAMEIWTKHDGEPLVNILKACSKYRVAPMVSFSITGMGGSALEPGVMKYNDLLDRIELMILLGYLNPKTTTIRIDPILPGYTKMDDIKNIVERCKKLGIKKFVTSVVQSYGYTTGKSDWTDKYGNVHPGDRHVVSGITEALHKEGVEYDWEKYYGTVTEKEFNEYNNFCIKYRAEHGPTSENDLLMYAIEAGIQPVRQTEIGNIAHIAKPSVVQEISTVLSKLNEDPFVEIESCSYPISGLKSSACLDPDIISAVVGTSVYDQSGNYMKDESRTTCCCYKLHSDLFSYDDKCPSLCAYCYGALGVNERFAKYYDNDGKLKDNPFTRVPGSERVVAAHPKNILMFSGGAYGADTLWDLIGTGKIGVPVTNGNGGVINLSDMKVLPSECMLSRNNIYHIVAPGVNLVNSSYLRDAGVMQINASEEAMSEARTEMGKILNRTFNANDYIDNLIVRDYLLVRKAGSVIAVATLENNNKSVKGGTRYAVMAGINRGISVYVYNIDDGKWYSYDKKSKQFVVYDKLVTLTQKTALVGSRSLQEYTKKDGVKSEYVGSEKAIRAMNAMYEVFVNTEQRAQLYDKLNITDDIAKLAEEVKNNCKGL